MLTEAIGSHRDAPATGKKNAKKKRKLRRREAVFGRKRTYSELLLEDLAPVVALQQEDERSYVNLVSAGGIIGSR